MTTAAPARAGLRKNLLWKLSGTVVDKGFRLALVVFATRTLGEDLWGRYAYAAAATALFSQMTDMGTALFLTREVARSGNVEPRLLGGLLQLRIGLAALYLVAVGVLAAMHANEPWLALALCTTGLGALAQGSLEACWAVFRGLERLELEARSQSLLSALYAAFGGVVVVAMIVGLLPRNDIGIVAFAGAQLLSAAVAFGLAARAVAGLARPVRGWDAALRQRFVREVLPLGLAIVASLIYFKIDIPMLRWMRGDGETGRYAASFRLLEMLAVVPAIAMSATFPALSRDIVGDAPRARRVHRAALTSLGGLGLGIAVVFGIAAEWIVQLLYGPEFAGSAAVLRVLGVSIALMFVNYLETHMLVALGLVRWQMSVAMALCLVNVGLNLWWIPEFGAVGAAWATACTELALLAAVMPAVHRGLAQAGPR